MKEKEIDWDKIKHNKRWCNFIILCQKVGYGNLAEIKVHDGAPITVETERKSIRLDKNGEEGG